MQIVCIPVLIGDEEALLNLYYGIDHSSGSVFKGGTTQYYDLNLIQINVEEAIEKWHKDKEEAID